VARHRATHVLRPRGRALHRRRPAVVRRRAGQADALDARTRLRAAGGLYTQSPGYEKLIQSDYFLDLTDTGARLDLRHARSWQALVGFERDLRGGVSMRVEGYFKNFERLAIGRLETPGEVAARLAAFDFPPEYGDSLPREPRITSFPVSEGSGRAYGADLFVVRREATERRLAGWLAYTWGRAERTAYGRTFPFEYDRRHALGAVVLWRARPRLDVALTGRFASGFPRTPVVGLRVAERADPRDADRRVPWLDAAGRPVYTIDLGGVANLNSARLPAFARVDLRATWFPGGRAGRWTLYLDVINVLNRDNAGALDPRLEYDPTSDRPRLVEEPTAALPILPSLGVRFRF
jgi:hypothetical protein